MKKSIISKISIISVVVCVFLSCERESEIVFSQTGVPVDLGLTVKWASRNVGANSPEDYGDYFAWGEIEPKDVYTWSSYKWCKGSETTLTKYNTISSHGIVDNKTQLELSDDAAHVNWGGSWRMPTDAELTELREQCTWTWTTQNGVIGYTVTGPNGNCIFLPATGSVWESSLSANDVLGYYWSSSLNTDLPNQAWFVVYSNRKAHQGYESRSYGFSVRPVCP